jgi:hypothetical protein
MTVSLPDGFADLQPFAAKWAKATEYERAAERRRATSEELKEFYDAALKRLPEILERADLYPLGAIDGADRDLFHIALSLCEVAPHVEFYRCDPQVPFAFDEHRLMGRHCATKD